MSIYFCIDYSHWALPFSIFFDDGTNGKTKGRKGVIIYIFCVAILMYDGVPV